MHHHRSIWIIGCVAVVIAVSGCRKNPLHCDGHPDNECDELADAPPIDTPPGCTGDPQCSGSAAVCNLATATCVQCTSAEATACVGTTPTCGSDDACRACAAHADCPSAACLPDGSCGTDANVAYVAPTGTDNALCTKAMACTKVAKALATGRPFVKFTGTTNEQVSINNQNVTLLADPGAKLSFTSAGVILKVDGTSVVTIHDLAITDGLGATGIGISMPAGNAAALTLDHVNVTNNAGGGISASGGTLTVTQSTISANQGGGILMSTTGVAVVTNNFIDHNGNTTTASAGGLSLKPATGSRVEFNTIVDNQANLGAASAGGVFCDVAGFVAADNLVFRNTGGPSGTVQTFGNCTYGNSFNAPGSSASDNTPGFASPNSQPFDYHLTATTPTTILNAAGACTGVDFDGDTRPLGGACDLGADEFKQ